MERNERIKKYRIAADLTWDRLAEGMNIEPVYLQHIMHGRMKPGPKTEHKLNVWYTRNRADIEAALAELVEAE